MREQSFLFDELQSIFFCFSTTVNFTTEMGSFLSTLLFKQDQTAGCSIYKDLVVLVTSVIVFVKFICGGLFEFGGLTSDQVNQDLILSITSQLCFVFDPLPAFICC